MTTRTSPAEIQARKMIKVAFGDLATLVTTQVVDGLRVDLKVRLHPKTVALMGVVPDWADFRDQRLRPFLVDTLVKILVQGALHPDKAESVWRPKIQDIARGISTPKNVIPDSEERPIVWDLADALALYPGD